jgi:hypothetical protein
MTSNDKSETLDNIFCPLVPSDLRSYVKLSYVIIGFASLLPDILWFANDDSVCKMDALWIQAPVSGRTS